MCSKSCQFLRLQLSSLYTNCSFLLPLLCGLQMQMQHATIAARQASPADSTPMGSERMERLLSARKPQGAKAQQESKGLLRSLWSPPSHWTFSFQISPFL